MLQVSVLNCNSVLFCSVLNPYFLKRFSSILPFYYSPLLSHQWIKGGGAQYAQCQQLCRHHIQNMKMCIFLKFIFNTYFQCINLYLRDRPSVTSPHNHPVALRFSFNCRTHAPHRPSGGRSNRVGTGKAAASRGAGVSCLVRQPILVLCHNPPFCETFTQPFASTLFV